MRLRQYFNFFKKGSRGVRPVVATMLIFSIIVGLAAGVLFILPLVDDDENGLELPEDFDDDTGEGLSEAVVQNVDSWQDTSNTGFCDKINVSVSNSGTANTTIRSADLLKNDLKVDSWELEEEKSLDSASTASIILSTDAEDDELKAGDTIKINVTTDDETVTSIEFTTPSRFTGDTILVIHNIYSWQDTSNTGLCDKVTGSISNSGTANTTIRSADLLKNDLKVDSWELEEEKSLDSASTISIVLSTDAEDDELKAGDTIKIRIITDHGTVTSDAYLTPGQFIGDTDLIRTVLKAYSHQDEGTGQFDDTTKIQSLDGDWGPTSPTGTVTHAYYATGTSPTYFDGIFVQFEGYDTATYDATIHIYIKDGHYSTSWHHYDVFFAGTGTDPDWTTDSAHQDQGPWSGATVWDDAEDETGLELTQTLDESGIPSSGNFWIFIRIWDASVDSVTLTLS